MGEEMEGRVVRGLHEQANPQHRLRVRWRHDLPRAACDFRLRWRAESGRRSVEPARADALELDFATVPKRKT